jgi:dihydroorotate dehydrogenase electron transfer subunit
MKQIRTRVIENNEIALNYYKMVFAWDAGNEIPRPGQFITIRVAGGSVPLLRRPFAFSGYDRDKGTASIIYVKRGPGTEILAHLSPGEYLDILGPLGNHMKPPGEVKNPILIAGGIGLGPILYFSTSLDADSTAHRFIFGARTGVFVPETESLKHEWPHTTSFHICTDDGSKGYSGTVVDFLKTIPEEEVVNSILYCCGPEPMLKNCHDFAVAYDIGCYTVMEQIMACGVGACMGCTIKVKSETGFARVCMEGPVFESRDIVWT